LIGFQSLLIALFFLISPSVWAALDFEDAAFPEFVTSARGLAMGNAYINKTDDAWSAFYNPAGLGTVRQPQFHLLNLHMEVSNAFLDAVGSVGAITNLPSNVTGSFDAQKIREKLVDNQGDISHLRANFFPNFTVRGMTLGYFLSQRNRAVINDDVDNKFEFAERRDQGPVFALNLPLFGGVFKVGASAMYVTRRELYKAVGPTDPIAIADTDYKKGSSLQVTVGSKITIPIALLPTFGFVLRNATNNDWEGAGAGGVPNDIPQTIDGAFSITPQIGSMSRLHFEVNYKDIGDRYETSASRRLGLGAELDFNRRIFIRAGSGDGWGSAGIGVRSKAFIMDLTTYAVDRDSTGFRKKEDRRFVLSLSSGF